MADFAKLFNTEMHGQILVMNDTDENGDPAVIFHFQPEGLGICKCSVNFKTDAWDAADACFAEVTEESAVSFVAAALAQSVMKNLLSKE